MKTSPTLHAHGQNKLTYTYGLNSVLFGTVQFVFGAKKAKYLNIITRRKKP